MLSISKGLASVAGIGYIGKGSGTVAALFTCIVWFLIKPALHTQILIIILVTLLGIWVSNLVEKDWHKDNQKVVIDELAGMCIALFLIPVSYTYVLIAFILFRFFDIVKPLYIRKAENLKGGFGVMMDDVVAGVYSNIILHIFIYCFNYQT